MSEVRKTDFSLEIQKVLELTGLSYAKLLRTRSFYRVCSPSQKEEIDTRAREISLNPELTSAPEETSQALASWEKIQATEIHAGSLIKELIRKRRKRQRKLLGKIPKKKRRTKWNYLNEHKGEILELRKAKTSYRNIQSFFSSKHHFAVGLNLLHQFCKEEINGHRST